MFFAFRILFRRCECNCDVMLRGLKVKGTFSKLNQGIRPVSSVICKSHVLSQGSVPAAPKLLPGLCQQQRWFWGVDIAFNKVDEERVKLAGPDRAAAEWVLKNGGAIKWTTSTGTLNDYNLLPSTDFESYKLEAIDLTGTDVIGLGFEHLKDLKHLKKIVLHGCRCAGDDALANFHHVKDTLEFLEISRCPMITEKGLDQLVAFKNLKHFVIYDLFEISNFPAVLSSLKSKMPWCNFDTTDPFLEKPKEAQ